jgi:hypothetical protein
VVEHHPEASAADTQSSAGGVIAAAHDRA